MDDEQYINIEDGLSVGAIKYVDPNEIITEEDFKYIINKIPELDERVGNIDDDIEEINSSLEDTTNEVNELKEVKADKSYVDSAIESVYNSDQLTNYAKINDNDYTTNSSVPKTNIPLNQIIYNTVSTTTGLPMTRAGFMETILPHSTSSQYGQQKYYPYGRNYTFARGVNDTGDGWFNWKQETHNTSLQTFIQTVGVIPGNSAVDVDLTIEGGMDNNFMHLLTIESDLKVGITYCTFKKSATIYTVRFLNLTYNPIDIGQIIMKFTTLEVVPF
jgi:hypothetical protein